MTLSQEFTPEAENQGEFEWISLKDGSKHFLRGWYARPAKALVLYLHGIEGHSLWFQDTAIFLKSCGISTLALDRRGSGLSPAARGDMKDYQELLNDISELIAILRQKHENMPFFLMANCWAAKLAALISCSDHPVSKKVNGLILSSPAIEVLKDLSLKEKLLLLVRYLANSKKTLPIPLAPSDFTDNPHYLEFINKDRLRLTDATARFFLNTFFLTIKSKAAAEKISMPLLIVQSGNDSIVEVQGIKKWYERLNSKDKSLEIFTEAHHSLDFDARPEKYRELLKSWILDRSAAEAVSVP